MGVKRRIMALLNRVLPVPLLRPPGGGSLLRPTEEEAAKDKPPQIPANPEPSIRTEKVKQPRPTQTKPNPPPENGGRPRHVASTVRDVRVTVSLSREEMGTLSALARDSGYSFSEWLRRIVFDVAKVAPRPHPERAPASGSIQTANKKYLEPLPPPPLPEKNPRKK